jgi:4-amino-4-deoxy-L-arabinose transferase-like glycosyltransferase
MKITGFRFSPGLWAVALFALTLVLRLSALDRYVTPDEPNWVYRTLNFGAALARGDWAGTVQAGHPGVTTMWLGSLGIALERAVDPARTADALTFLSKLDRLSSENVAALKRIGVFLDWARLPVIVVNALGVVGVFWLARRIFDRRVALLAALLLALDPFVAGLGGLLHVDGLLTTFSTLSVLALLNGVSRIAYRVSLMADSKSPTASGLSTFDIQHSALPWFALSGAFAGLAALSKSPALFLTPFTLVVFVAVVLAKHLSVGRAAVGFLTFIILHSALFIALYPAMWSDPSAAVDLMFERASHHAATATRETFFDGQAELNLGPGFYPVALAYRLSPVAIVGLALAAFYIVRQQTSSDRSRPAILALIIFSLAFIVFLSPAAKKFDRYLLPIIPPLILVAAWGIGQFANPRLLSFWVSDASPLAGASHPTNKLTYVLPSAAVVLQALYVLSVAPYPLMAYNPMLGGAAGARDRIAVGWGEGYAAAAAWVEEHDRDAVIASGGLSNIAPLFEGRVVTIDATGLASADYIIFTVSEMQLALEFFGSLAQQGRLTQTIRIGGIEAAWIYRATAPGLQADWLRQHLQSGDAIVLDAATPLARLLDAPPTTSLPPDATPDLISDTLAALRDRSRIWYVSTAAASTVVRAEVRDWLATNARPTDEAQIAGATIRSYTPESGAPIALDPFRIQFDGAVALIGLEPVTAVAAYPDRIAVAARWRVLNPPAANYSVTLELTDAYGDTWTQLGGPLRDARDFAPIDWQPGEVVDQVFAAPVPPALAPGVYRLRFSIDLPDGQRAGLVSASGAFSGTAPLLAAVQIDPAPPSFEPDTIDARQRIEHAWPDVAELISMDLLTYVVATGDQFLATLHWRSLRDGLDPATELRWTLEPESVSDNSARSFEWRTALAPNTTEPLFSGDVLSARYAQRLPLDLPDGRYRLLLTLAGATFDVAPIDLWHRDRKFDLPDDVAREGSVGAFEVYRVEPLPAQTRAGDPLEVKLAIQAREEVAVNYTLFVHLVDSEDRVVAQVDTWPQGGQWPTANWVRGQVVEDTLTLMPSIDDASGAYRIAVGMYDALDGTRLLVRDRDGRIAPDGRLVLDAPIQIIAP